MIFRIYIFLFNFIIYLLLFCWYLLGFYFMIEVFFIDCVLGWVVGWCLIGEGGGVDYLCMFFNFFYFKSFLLDFNLRVFFFGVKYGYVEDFFMRRGCRGFYISYFGVLCVMCCV